MTADLLAYMLDHRGFEVIRAYSGGEALAQIRALRPDAVILDVMMPTITGQDVTRALRLDPQLESTPVVLFSSVDEADVPWQAAGADAFLQKPIDICALPELVQQLIEGRSPRPIVIGRRN
jgi:CheY-like chemotaxis protein